MLTLKFFKITFGQTAFHSHEDESSFHSCDIGGSGTCDSRLRS